MPDTPATPLSAQASEAAAAKPEPKQEYRFAEDAGTKDEGAPRGTMAAAAAAAEESSSEEDDDEEEEDVREESGTSMPGNAKHRRGSSATTWAEDDDEAEEGAVTPAASEAPNALVARPVSYVPAVIDTSDLRTFLMTPGPVGAMVQCYIQRRKTGMARLFPTYEIYLKEGDKFLMAARKRKKNKSSNYLISLDKDDLSRNSGNFYGKLRSNFIGTEFTLYDKGANPDKKVRVGLLMCPSRRSSVLDPFPLSHRRLPLSQSTPPPRRTTLT